MTAPAGDRFTGLELALAGLLAASMAVQRLLQVRLLPLLNAQYDDFAMQMSLPSRMYLEAASWTPVAVAVIVLLWIAFAAVRRPWLAQTRRAVLITGSALVTAGTLTGLYLLAGQAVIQLTRLADVNQEMIITRDILSVHLAAGAPADVIAILDPGRTGDYPGRGLKLWGAPGDAFRLAEAYSQEGNVESARRIYRAAKESAAGFDELVAERTAKRARLGLGAGWGPSERDLKQLSALVRAVADLRLEQLQRDPAGLAALPALR